MERSHKSRTNTQYSFKIKKPLGSTSKYPYEKARQWVNRSPEQRQQEVAERNGKITRPLNAFMLYRMDNASYIRENIEGGLSWALEPKKVKEIYADLALEDQIRHVEAHPEYKLTQRKFAKTEIQDSERWESALFKHMDGHSHRQTEFYNPSELDFPLFTSPLFQLTDEDWDNSGYVF
ncbi:hypothetical protein TSTA_110260 [Talaromyces stipitatus ATCC 10500]|uniref:HMG box domain-containing protein n=1 Tax=Talaromyces stipitatus (strain ATCC 10500 / CBS 375.48 / QM 6759 / NRRL 1006) TaxID=441959 RepID=B8MUH4_TALSN|nr:uncharacterized protein TSTA_110260 [Talaromyces stipitatus ATCC 10500]EED11846.1 hypothetical protein TSTA_110260 [Talaromyces stipitatus ATCC 10500]